MKIQNVKSFRENIKQNLPKDTEEKIIDEIVKYCQSDAVKPSSDNDITPASLSPKGLSRILTKMVKEKIKDYHESVFILDSSKNAALKKVQDFFRLIFDAKLPLSTQMTSDPILINFINKNGELRIEMVNIVSTGLNQKGLNQISTEILNQLIRLNLADSSHVASSRICFNKSGKQPFGIYNIKELSILWGNDNGKDISNIEGFIFQLAKAYQKTKNQDDVNVLNSLINQVALKASTGATKAMVSVLQAINAIKIEKVKDAADYIAIALNELRNNYSELEEFKLQLHTSGLLNLFNFDYDKIVEMKEVEFFNALLRSIPGINPQLKPNEVKKYADKLYQHIHFDADLLQKSYLKIENVSEEEITHKRAIVRALVLSESANLSDEMISVFINDPEFPSVITDENISNNYKEKIIEKLAYYYNYKLNNPDKRAILWQLAQIVSNFDSVYKYFKFSELDEIYRDALNELKPVSGIANLSKLRQTIFSIASPAELKIFYDNKDNKLTSLEILQDPLLINPFKEKLPELYGKILAEYIAFEMAPPIKSNNPADNVFKDAIEKQYSEVDAYNLINLLKDERLFDEDHISHRQAILRAILAKHEKDNDINDLNAFVWDICYNSKNFNLKVDNILNDNKLYSILKKDFDGQLKMLSIKESIESIMPYLDKISEESTKGIEGFEKNLEEYKADLKLHEEKIRAIKEEINIGKGNINIEILEKLEQKLEILEKELSTHKEAMRKYEERTNLTKAEKEIFITKIAKQSYEDLDIKTLKEFLKESKDEKAIDHRISIFEIIVSKISSDEKDIIEINDILDNIKEFHLDANAILSNEVLVKELTEKTADALWFLHQKYDSDHELSAVQYYKILEKLTSDETKWEIANIIIDKKSSQLRDLSFDQAWDVFSKVNGDKRKEKAADLILTESAFVERLSDDNLNILISAVSVYKLIKISKDHKDSNIRVKLAEAIIKNEKMAQAKVKVDKATENLYDELVPFGKFVSAHRDDIFPAEPTMKAEEVREMALTEGQFNQVSPFLRAVALKNWLSDLKLSGRELIDLSLKTKSPDVLNAIRLDTMLGKDFIFAINHENPEEHQKDITFLKDNYDTAIYKQAPLILIDRIKNFSPDEIVEILKCCSDEIKEVIFDAIVPYNSKLYTETTIEFRTDLFSEYVKEKISLLEKGDSKVEKNLIKLAEYVNSYEDYINSENIMGDKYLFPVLENIFSQAILYDYPGFFNIIDDRCLSVFILHCMNHPHAQWAQNALDNIVNYAYNENISNEKHLEISKRIRSIFSSAWTERYASKMTEWKVETLKTDQDYLNFAIQIQKVLLNPNAVARLTADEFLSAVQNYERISKILKSQQYLNEQKLLDSAHFEVVQLENEILRKKLFANHEKMVELSKIPSKDIADTTNLEDALESAKKQENASSVRFQKIKDYQVEWAIKGTLVQLRNNLDEFVYEVTNVDENNKKIIITKSEKIDPKVKNTVESYLNLYNTEAMKQKNSNGFMNTLYTYLLGKPKGDIAEQERPWYEKLVKYALDSYVDNLVTADLKIPVGTVTSGDVIYDSADEQIRKKLGIIDENGVIKSHNNPNGNIYQEGIKVGTELYDHNGNFLGTLDPHGKINPEILFGLQTAQAMLLDAASFDDMIPQRRHQLYKRIIDLKGLIEFLPEMLKKSPQAFEGFVEYLKSEKPDLTPVEWKEIAYWVNSNQFEDIFEAYALNPLEKVGDFIGIKSFERSQHNAQKFLFGLLSHPIQLGRFQAADVLKMFNDARISANEAIEKADSHDFSAYPSNLLRAYALSDSTYINSIHKNKDQKISSEFKEVVSKLNLENLPENVIKKLRKRVRMELISSGNFKQEHYESLSHDFNSNDLNESIGDYIKSMSAKDAVIWVMKQLDEKAAAKSKDRLGYEQALIKGLLRRPSCVKILSAISLKENDITSSMTEVMKASSTHIKNNEKSVQNNIPHLMKIIGKSPSDFLKECFRALGKGGVTGWTKPVSEGRKKAVHELSRFLHHHHKSHRDKTSKRYLSDDHKKISKDAGEEAGYGKKSLFNIFGRNHMYLAKVENNKQKKNKEEAKAKIQEQQQAVSKPSTGSLFKEVSSNIYLKELQQDITNFVNTAKEGCHTPQENVYIQAYNDSRQNAEEINKKASEKQADIPEIGTAEYFEEAKKLITDIAYALDNIKKINAYKEWADRVRKGEGGFNNDNDQKLLWKAIKDKKFDVEFDLLNLENLIELADMLERGAGHFEKQLIKDLPNLKERVAISMKKRLDLFARTESADLLYDLVINTFGKDRIGDPGNNCADGDLLRSNYDRKILRNMLVVEIDKETKNFVASPVLKKGETPREYMESFIDKYCPDQAIIELEKVSASKPIIPTVKTGHNPFDIDHTLDQKPRDNITHASIVKAL